MQTFTYLRSWGLRDIGRGVIDIKMMDFDIGRNMIDSEIGIKMMDFESGRKIMDSEIGRWILD